ncbi:ABC transporter ATP-binding protein [Falsibacillus pallidus]|uniref:ATP-binding cassette subfamily C protein n=1 Tax=Falsibacillus pallidus TaxID=493781 RepID=A0A370GQW1_9BACI|nr:ABC transporter ATP-binding protein [Falsibacillus pallidus]RDI45700.1 ATP-binding cassette subfamily C protein [Falsibacillus pallidus]
MKPLFQFAKKLHHFSGKIVYYNLLGMVFISLLEGIGIILLIPMIHAAGILQLNGSGSFYMAKFNELIHPIPVQFRLPIFLGIYIILVFLQSSVQRKLTIRSVKIQQEFSSKLRRDLYKDILDVNWGFLLSKRKSELVNSLTSDIARVTSGINLLLQFCSAVIFTTIQVGIAFMLSAKLTLLIVIFGMLIVFLSKRFLKKSRSIGKQTSEISLNYLSGITDQINGIKEIKSNHLEKTQLKWMKLLTQQMMDEQIEYITLKTSSQSFYKLSSAILVSFFLLISLTLFQSSSQELMLILVIFSRLWPRFTIIQANLEQIFTAMPAFSTVQKLQEDCLAAKETIGVNEGELKNLKIVQGFELKNIYFRYNTQIPSYTLEDITIKIPVNTMTAIIGHSGAGKSTLIDILMGLNKAEKGEVLIDQMPLTSQNILSLRKSLSYVPQDPFLFNGTIRENLLLVSPSASEEEIWQSLHFAAADEFVEDLPRGLDTVIGDRGMKLSGGERQRIVLARALLRKPSILVLDEATSALDSENESKIQEAIDQLKGSMTIIVIAHRLSTIKNADQVIVLDHGKAVQQEIYAKFSTV